MSHSVPRVIVCAIARENKAQGNKFNNRSGSLTQQRGVWEDRGRYRFEEARERRRAVGFRASVDVNRRIDEVQLLLRARGRDVEQPPLLVEVVKLILKPVRRKPAIGHPDHKHVVPLETFR